jgi:phytol kinase
VTAVVDLAAVGAWLPILGIMGSYAALLAAAEVVRHRVRVSAELTRKLAHVGGGVLALAFPAILTEPWQAVAIACVFSAAFVIARWTGRLRSIHGVGRMTVGAELYPVGIAAAFLLAQGNWGQYAVAVLSLAIADSMAAFVGGRWGRRHVWIWGTARSLEGSAAAWTTALVVAFLVLWITAGGGAYAVVVALSVASAVAAVEAISPGGLDNLTIPVAASLAIAAPMATAVAIAALLVLLVLLLTFRGNAARSAASASVFG